MSSGLAVGVGIGVATDELALLSRSTRSAAEHCTEVQRRLPPLRTGDLPAADADLWEVEAAVRRSAEQLDDLADALRTAALLYETGERTVALAVETVAAQAAAAAGLMISRLGIVLVPGLIRAAATVAIGWALLSDGGRAQLMAGAASLLSDPRAVEALRAALSLADDTLLGALGLPPVVVSLLGETGAGLSGVDAAAGLIGGDRKSIV